MDSLSVLIADEKDMPTLIFALIAGENKMMVGQEICPTLLSKHLFPKNYGVQSNLQQP